MRIISYNLNGIRAAIKKGFIDWLQTNPADVICIQETKAVFTDIDVTKAALLLGNYGNAPKIENAAIVLRPYEALIYALP